MPEDRVNIVDALRGQQEQLKRLIAQKMWISDAPKATLSEIKAQLGELKRLLTQLESDIQVKKRTGTQPMRRRSPNAAAKRVAGGHSSLSGPLLQTFPCKGPNYDNSHIFGLFRAMKRKAARC